VPTLKDISALIGVSVTQVSRALNDHSDVSEETKRRVREAVKQLNYRPNVSARGLRTGRTGFVALVMHEVPAHPSGGYYMRALSVMSRTFDAAGFQLVLHVARDEGNRLLSYQRMIESGSVDGFVLNSVEHEDPRIPYLTEMGVPFVAHGSTDANPKYPFFDIDNHYVGYKLTSVLIAKGHRRIAFLNGPANRAYAHNRWRGYLAAHADAGLGVDPALHVSGQMTEHFGALETFRLADRGATRPTAVIAGNVRIAKGVLQVLRTMSLSVPRDMSVVAHDDGLEEDDVQEIVPALTTTVEPLMNSWEPVAEALIGAITGKETRQPQKIARPRFVSRASVGPAPG